MSNSLRDQLMGLGFKPLPKSERKPEQKGGGGRPQARSRPGASPAQKPSRPHPPKPPREPGEIDLAKAYALRAQREQEERLAAQKAKEEEARRRREARAKLAELLKGRTLNDPDAEIARHFEYGGKIKRIYVNAEQLRALNAGELGVVQLDGRYLLVTAATLAEAEAVFPPCVALKVDPNAPAEDDPYADPKYQVPDDLVW
ncbi:MAG: DUF2058 domain-containing protein [Pseudomonadota bacterium]|jgi:uncharacterized protein YaiL (DUF2058 family)